MVDLTNGVTGMLPKVSTQGLISGVMWFLIGTLIVGVLAFVIWYNIKKKKYSQYKVEIFDRDSNGNVYKEYDRAGVFLDKKTNLRLLFLEKYKSGLNPNNIPYVSSLIIGGKLFKHKETIRTIYLRRIGVNNYVFCNVTVGTEGLKISVGEEDLNNAAQEMTKIRHMYNKESWLSKFAPYIMFVISMLLLMIVIISLSNKLAAVKDVAANMLRVAELNQKSTELLYNLTQSPTMNKNMPIIVPSSSGGG
jgi:uncharacterized membrane protein